MKWKDLSLKERIVGSLTHLRKEQVKVQKS